ncbi:hypothetical protein AB0O01_35180 [Streptomyces sp. NPDC093252]|uniref:hypothetical protein n=1 Tax=Streptomyces sp. NPDC093252 TaxID=3154980 RepID=UPI003413E352
MLTAAIAAVTMLSLSSCAAPDSGPDRASQESAPEGRTHTPSHSGPAQPAPEAEANPLPLPVQKYLLTPSVMSEINPATLILANSCLQQQNITPVKHTAPPDGRENRSDPYEVGRRYGPIIESDVNAYGYHLPPGWFGEATSAPKMSASQKAAMNGPTGCLAAARKELIGERSLDSPIARQISSKSFMESLKDPKVKAATADWSACMAKKGHSYTGPLEALSKADLTTPEPSPAELRIASADYSCKVSTDLISIWQKVETGIQEKEIAKNLPALEKANAQRIQVMAEAEEISSRVE